VLLGVDGGLEVFGPVAGRRGQDHQVNVGSQQLLIALKAHKSMFGRNLHAFGDRGIARVALEPAQVALELIFEDVGHGDELGGFVGGQQVHDGLPPASSQADHAGFQFFLAGPAHQFRLDVKKGRSSGQHRPA